MFYAIQYCNPKVVLLFWIFVEYRNRFLLIAKKNGRLQSLFVLSGEI